MVVLAAAITTKTGKALLSRQFVELSKVRIEGLLAAFPKLMGTEKQHTFVETENVRYVYQPLETLYILLITNKSSNILEDLESLHLLAKIVPEYCHALEERQIIVNAFDIIFAFDEAIAMGYKERVNLQQIKHFTEMESHDEIRYKAEQKAKMVQAKKEAEKQRKAIEKKKLEDRRSGIGFDDRHVPGSYSSASSSPTPSRSSFSSEPIVESRREAPKSESRGGGKGMQLGKAKKTGYSQVLEEEDVPDTSMPTSPSSTSSAVSSGAPQDKIQIAVSEKIVLVAENDGGLKNMEVKGELTVTIFDNQFSQIRIRVRQTDKKEFQFKTHPNMNKQLYTSDNVLALKDNSKSYPLSTPSSILKWRFTSSDESSIPLTINVWPSTSGGETTVPVEFEKLCPFDLYDVVIAIPIPGPAPVIGEIVGSSEFDSRKNILYWRVPLIDDSNRSGSMEFTVPAAAASSFFPVKVSFKSNQTFAALQVQEVTVGDNRVEYGSESLLSVEQYDIE